MARLVFPPGKQKEYLELVLRTMGVTADELGKVVGVCARTLRDWKREKFYASEHVIMQMSRISGVPCSGIIEKKDDWWSAKQNARKGALKRLELYGVTLKHEDRVKGGINSQLARRMNPEKYKVLGCNIPKNFQLPQDYSQSLAEFFGILLGDGGITPCQIGITLNSEADKNYRGYVIALVRRLFHEQPTVIFRKDSKAVVLQLSGVNLVHYCVGKGLKVGNKVKQQVDVPLWIKKSKLYSRYCVRGLIDTDGCIFINRYQVNGKWYMYRKLDFSNKSKPLLKFVYDTLMKNDLHPIYYQDGNVRICSEKETLRYLNVIGTSNTRLQQFSKLI
jgi:hypothetical protein